MTDEAPKQIARGTGSRARSLARKLAMQALYQWQLTQQTAGEIKAPDMAAPQEERGENGDLGGAPLDPRLTFESFIVGRSNALAHAAADRVSHAPNGQVIYNPLYLHAGVGLGILGGLALDTIWQPVTLCAIAISALAVLRISLVNVPAWWLRRLRRRLETDGVS